MPKGQPSSSNEWRGKEERTRSKADVITHRVINFDVRIGRKKGKKIRSLTHQSESGCREHVVSALYSIYETMEGAAPTQVQVQVQEQEQEQVQEQPKHVRVPVVRQSKHKGAGSRKGAEVPLCSVCGTTKKNRAAVICSICGPLCFGCDLSK